MLNDIDNLLDDAIGSHQARNFNSASVKYLKILEKDAFHADTNHNFGLLKVELGLKEEALIFLQTAINTNPNVLQYWVTFVNTLTNVERFGDARSVLEHAHLFGHKDETLNHLRHNLDLAQMKYETLIKPDQLNASKSVNAETDYENSLKVKQKTSMISQLDACIQNSDKHQTSILDEMKLDKALKLANKKAKEGLSEEAKNIYQDIINKFPKNKRAIDGIKTLASKTLANTSDTVEPPGDQFQNLVNLYTQGQYQEALTQASQLLKQFSNSFNLYNILGAANQSLGKLDEAIEAYSRAISIEPDYAEAYKNMGIALKGQGKLGEAIDAYNKAISIEPDYAEAIYNMGNVLQEQGELEEAIVAYNQAISIQPNYVDAYSNMGVTLKEQGKLDEAIEAYNKALAFKPDCADAYYNMGNVLKEQGMLDDTIEAYNKALAFKPDYAEAWTNGAEALEKWNKLDELEMWLKKAFNTFDKVPEDLKFMKSKLLWRNKKFQETSNLLFDIKLEAISEIWKQGYLQLKAKCFDQAKKFEEAYDCFARSNSLAKTSKEYLNLNPENYFQNLKDKFTEIKVSSNIKGKVHPKESTEFSPTFLVGFPRSGTTLLDTILRSHSKIKVIEEKPLLTVAENFLNGNGYHDFTSQVVPQKLNKRAQNVYKEEFKKYVKIFKSGSVCIDKLPLNLLEVPLIHQLYPDAKFILALRHPMDSILSCWMQNFKLNAAMANMVDLDRIVDFYCIAMETFKLCRTKYSLNVHEIRYEDLISNFRNETEAVVQFLNLQWEPEMENYQDTALNRGRITTPSYSQVVQPIYKDAQYRWLNYRKYLEQYLGQVKPWISEFGYD